MCVYVYVYARDKQTDDNKIFCLLILKAKSAEHIKKAYIYDS